ncbi:MAG TPA: methyltransferase domain-containing protein [Thermomicrobiales bacterium]|jgi:ubiquinone/menaquinone biosynthesis C-methylase UbiE|nr:methyltransferase domain-containing protein [Thermomicrobiales bacterium]
MPDSSSTAKDAVRRQYGAVGDAYVRSVGHATGSDLARMVEVAAPRPDDALLDIATGGGHVARVFATHVASVVASDLTPEILRHAAAALADWGLTNVTTAVADAEDLPFDDASFDIVTCRIAPHHFPRPDVFVREVARVLRPGGRFVLVDSTVPEGEAGDFFNRFETLRDPSHVRSLTIEEWQDLLVGAGLRVGVVESFTKTHDFADWTSRSRTSDEDRAALARMLLDAPGATRRAFGVTVDPADPDQVQGFTDTKTLFVAIRSAS